MLTVPGLVRQGPFPKPRQYRRRCTALTLKTAFRQSSDIFNSVDRSARHKGIAYSFQLCVYLHIDSEGQSNNLRHLA
jgi:hypothetical protein